METIMSKKEELQHLKELLIQALKRNDKYDIKYLTPRIVELIGAIHKANSFSFDRQDKWCKEQKQRNHG